MYSVKSNAVWHSLPGVVAAYQPIVAPNPFAAQQNVAYQGARFGVYTATPGTLPTWAAHTGWTGDGSTQYLSTGIVIANTTWSVIVRFRGATRDNDALFGTYGPGATSRFYYNARHSATSSHQHINGSGTSYLRVAPMLSAGVAATCGKTGYLNGIAEGTLAAGTFDTALPVLFVLGSNNNGTPSFALASIQSFLVVSRTLSPAEVWLASRQMAYCEKNPDWNAWVQRRIYFYAPQAAATFNPAWARNANIVIKQANP